MPPKKKTERKQNGPKVRVSLPARTEDEIKEDIMLMVAVQWTEDEIAKTLGIEHKELKAKYQNELDLGPLKERLLVLKALRRKAHTGDVSAGRFLISLGEENKFLRNKFAQQPKAPAKQLVKKVKAAKAPEPKLGKKQEALLTAKTAHKGTTWDDHLKH